MYVKIEQVEKNAAADGVVPPAPQEGGAPGNGQGAGAQFSAGLSSIGENLGQSGTPYHYQPRVTKERHCLCDIPLWVKIPEPKTECRWLGLGRSSFYRLIDLGVLIQLPVKGLKEGNAIFGPSICDARFGCRCGLQGPLDVLRRQAATARGRTGPGTTKQG
jgi:hypothetical protein